MPLPEGRMQRQTVTADEASVTGISVVWLRVVAALMLLVRGAARCVQP